MFARATLVEIDVLRASVQDAAKMYQEIVLPGLRGRHGYEGVLALGTPEGKGLIITFWDDEESARELGEAAYLADVEKFVTLYRSAPGREDYEVLVAELPRAELVG